MTRCWKCGKGIMGDAAMWAINNDAARLVRVHQRCWEVLNKALRATG